MRDRSMMDSQLMGTLPSMGIIPRYVHMCKRVKRVLKFVMQIIWPDTSRVGIAKAKYANKDAMVYVAQYQSRGNFMGRSAYTGK